MVVIQDDLTGMEDDITDIEVDHAELEGDVNFLFAEQVLQDERLFSLEQDNDDINDELESELILVDIRFSFGIFCQLKLKIIDIVFADLQDTTLALDFRVTVLEENGGGDGNSSVAELEVRVETVEGTVADHETRISATEVDVNGRYPRIQFTVF